MQPKWDRTYYVPVTEHDGSGDGKALIWEQYLTDNEEEVVERVRKLAGGKCGKAWVAAVTLLKTIPRLSDKPAHPQLPTDGREVVEFAAQTTDGIVLHQNTEGGSAIRFDFAYMAPTGRGVNGHYDQLHVFTNGEEVIFNLQNVPWMRVL